MNLPLPLSVGTKMVFLEQLQHTCASSQTKLCNNDFDCIGRRTFCFMLTIYACFPAVLISPYISDGTRYVCFTLSRQDVPTLFLLETGKYNQNSSFIPSSFSSLLIPLYPSLIVYTCLFYSRVLMCLISLRYVSPPLLFGRNH